MEQLFLIPRYLVTTLKLSGYEQEDSIQRAMKRDPQQLKDTLEQCGQEIQSADLYPEDIKNKFNDDCMDAYVHAGNKFKILPGHWDLLQEVVENLDNKKFIGKKTRLSRKRKREEFKKESHFTVSNIERLNNLLMSKWPVELLEQLPTSFSIKEESELVWNVNCNICQASIKIFLNLYNGTVSFNRGNFKRHLLSHSQKVSTNLLDSGVHSDGDTTIISETFTHESFSSPTNETETTTANPKILDNDSTQSNTTTTPPFLTIANVTPLDSRLLTKFTNQFGRKVFLNITNGQRGITNAGKTTGRNEGNTMTSSQAVLTTMPNNTEVNYF